MKIKVKKTSSTYIIKKIFDDFVYAVFDVLDPKPESGKDMPPIETEEEAEKRQKTKSSSESEIEEKANEEYNKIMEEIEKSSESDSLIREGLKIITPNQLLTRLPILLAQKKAGNNSQKLNNEIRQIIYSLYSSKKNKV